MQDGYAVVATDGPGEYVVAFSAHAGHQQPRLESGSAAYITTGEQRCHAIVLTICQAAACLLVLPPPTYCSPVCPSHVSRRHKRKSAVGAGSYRVRQAVASVVRFSSVSCCMLFIEPFSFYEHLAFQDVLENVQAGLLGCLTHKGVYVIAAGAPVPEGADAVVQIENTQQLPDRPDGEKRIKIVKVCAFCSNTASI